jgi:hypothetical protein
MDENEKTTEIVDIRDISIDPNLPVNERKAEFSRQLNLPNPYRCGVFTITEQFADTEITFEDCLRQSIT